jgi:hypothetical protein
MPDRDMPVPERAGRMAVPDMPGQPGQIAPDLHQRFRGGNDTDQPPVIKRECIAVIKVDHVGKINQKCQPPNRNKPFSPHHPFVIGHHDCACEGF